MEELHYEDLAQAGIIHPGDIILSAFPGSALAKAILAGQSLISQAPANWGHAMRASSPTTVISQEWKVVERSLKAWRGQRLRIWHNPTYSPAQRERLVTETRLALGRSYDLLGLIGQGLRALPVVGQWLGQALEVPWLTYCSELVCFTERKVNPQFMHPYPTCQVSPQEIDDWLSTQPHWHPTTVELV